MKKILYSFIFLICCSFYNCSNDPEPIDIVETDIAEEIIGEWVYDHPEENAWQSMKFVAEGSFFCYSNNKDNWTETLKTINKGVYAVKGMVISASNGGTYLDMTVSKINGYEFTSRLNETTVDFNFNKVIMRTHLTFGQSILPPYEDLVDAAIISYKSHEESIATVDSSTGEITAVANNGRTYVDVITNSGTAVIKVMIGKVNDGDEAELSPIKGKTITPPQPILNLPKAILGTWIWDINYFESISFLENGEACISNKDAARGLFNENAPGNYTIDTSTNRITMDWTPTGGNKQTVIMAITTISKYSFTAKFYDNTGFSNGTFTYSKLLNAIELKCDETVHPDYESIVEDGTVITQYKSHNSNIVEVNGESGEMTAKMGGITYIDVITEDGTAVVKVTVNSFMEYNYEEFIGAKRQMITKTFGFTYTTDGDDLIYNYRKGSLAEQRGAVKDPNWDYITFRFDSTTSLVKAIVLLAKEDVWFTPEEMTQHLSQRFYVYEKGTEEDFKAFINAENLEDATVGITWVTTNGILTYVEITHEKETSVLDYGGYLGKTHDEVKSMMSGYSLISETDERIGYMIGSDYLRMARFSFKAGDVIKETVQEVDLYLNTDIDQNFVKSEIEKNYVYSDGVEGNFLNYYSEDKTIRVVYQIGSNLIQFIQQ